MENLSGLERNPSLVKPLEGKAGEESTRSAWAWERQDCEIRNVCYLKPLNLW